MRPRLAVPVAFLTLWALPAALAGQQVQGRVMDDDNGLPVAGATVTLKDSTGQVLRRGLTGDLGQFWLWHTEAGVFTLSVERLGYAPVVNEPVRLTDEEVVEVEIHMQPEAVPVEPLRVVTRRHIERFTADEFYDRMSRLSDRGSFMTRERIEETGASLPSLAIQWAPGTYVVPSGDPFVWNVQMLSYGGRCAPPVYVDGRRLPRWARLDEWVMIDRIEGIEVYRGHFVPGTYPREPESWGCGAILVWTKPGADPRFAFTWRRTALFAVLGGLVMGLHFIL